MLWIALAALTAASSPVQEDRYVLTDGELPFPPERPSLAAPLVADANQEWVQIRGREWFARLSGKAESDATTKGTRLSISSDLDLGSQEDVPEIQAYVNVPYLGRFYLGWWRYATSSDPTLTRTIDFAGFTFTNGSKVHTSIDLNVAYLTYEYTFPKISLGGVSQLELGLELGLRGFGAEASISTAGSESMARGTIPMVVLGGHATVQILPWIRAEAEVVGISVSISAEKVTYVETFAEVVAQPLPWLFAGVGYKYMQLTYRYESRLNFDLDVELSGAYVTIGVRF